MNFAEVPYMSCSRLRSIDFFKWMASLMIISIHASLFSDLSDCLYFFTVQIAARMAVPYFAITSGYLIASKVNSQSIIGGTSERRFYYSHWIKMIRIYLGCTAVYLVYSIPSWIATGWFSPWAFVDYFIATAIRGSHYHLWYLLSAIYAFPLFCFFLIKIRTRYFLPAAIGLYFVKVLWYAYRPFTPQVLRTVWNCFDIFDAVANGFFCVLPFFLAGAFQYKHPLIKKNNLCWISAISFLFLSAEAILLSKAGIVLYSYIFLTFPTAYFAFSLILRTQPLIDADLCKKLGKSSLPVYCFHPIVLETIAPFTSNTVVRFLFTALLTNGLALIGLDKFGRGRIQKPPAPGPKQPSQNT